MKKKTNIVFILSDDHGYWANGCYGNKKIKTPNIDQLAEDGIRFDNFYCTSPVCSPARASILTGMIPSQHGVHDWLAKGCIRKQDYDHVQVSKKRYIASLGEKTDLDYKAISDQEKVDISRTAQYKFIQHEDDETIQYLKGKIAYPEILSENGYKCGIIGKWHLGDSRHVQMGFDEWSVIGKGGCIYHLPDFYRNGELIMGDRYITDMITDQGIDFIDTCHLDKEPFYLGLHYTAPHSPWIKEDQPEEIWNLYEDLDETTLLKTPLHEWQVTKRHPDCVSEQGRKYMLQGYYTAVTAMDRSIGRLIKHLEKLKIREETLIVFTSDNGMNMGHHGIWGKGNGTYPQNMYDTSVKVPMIMSHKARIGLNRVSSSMLSHYDLLPTLLEYVNLGDSIPENLPGNSFVPILEGDICPESHIIIYDEYGPVRMIRSHDWKLIYRHPDGPHELYHMKNDPEERNNLIDDQAYFEICKALKDQLNNWFNNYVLKENDGIHLPVTGDGQKLKVNQTSNINEMFRLRV